MIGRKYDQAQVAIRGNFSVKIDQDLVEGGRSTKRNKKEIIVNGSQERHSGWDETRAEEEWGLTVVVLASVVVVGRVASKVCCTCISRTKWVAHV